MTKQTKEALKKAIEYIESQEIKLSFDNLKEKQHTLQACKEALEQPTLTYEDGFAHGYEAHRAEQALEQPAQEPVAWIKAVEVLYIQSYKEDERVTSQGWRTNLGLKPEPDDVPLYTHPAPSWQGLSDDEISHLKYLHVDYELFDEGEYGTECNVYVDEFARAIEQALKEKNAVI